jgi:hypothetical protein
VELPVGTVKYPMEIVLYVAHRRHRAASSMTMVVPGGQCWLPSAEIEAFRNPS